MAYDPRIILAGQQPDYVNILARSGQAAGINNDVRKQNALAQLYQTQGAGILGGDQGAMNAFAAIDPMAALGVQGAQQDMQLAQAQEGRLGRQEKRLASADDRAAKLAQAKQEIEREASALLSAPDAVMFDRIAAETGNNELVGQFQNRHAVIAGMVDGPMAQINAELEKAKLNAPPKPGNDYERYAEREKAAGRQPLDEFAYRDKTRGGGFKFTGPDGMEISFGGAQEATTPGGPAIISNPDNRSVPEGVDFTEATGAQGFVANLANTISDAVGAGLVAPGNERATQAMQNLATNTMVTLADGVAGKPSNFLLEQFQQLSSQPNSIWQGEGRTKERLNQTRAMIEQGILMNKDVASTSETATLRSAAKANIARLSRLLSDYDAVIESFGKRDGAKATVKPWMTDTDPSTWTEEQMLEAERAWGIKK